jgi:hypothetical protein
MPEQAIYLYIPGTVRDNGEITMKVMAKYYRYCEHINN